MDGYTKLCKDILDLMITAYWQGCEDSKGENPALEDGFRADAELMIMNMLSKNEVVE